MEEEKFSTDAEQLLIERLQAGDAEAFTVLFQRYSARVLRQAMHLLGNEAEAEEVMQEVFLTLYEKANTLRGAAALLTWLYRLTANAALSRLRRRKRRPEVSMDDYLRQCRADGHRLVRPVVDWSQDVKRYYATAELRQVLQQAIEALPPLDKAVPVLSDVEDLSNRDMGEIFGLSVLAVKARLHRARLFLRGKLAVTLDIPPLHPLPRGGV
ncbi:MAG TPA: sigma-70 family RNA polymerase sigma factor [Candidatus Tectomicrobia bacterium]|jgi:RNA polymerase sigma-70 factor (ECF subfamily)